MHGCMAETVQSVTPLLLFSRVVFLFSIRERTRHPSPRTQVLSIEEDRRLPGTSRRFLDLATAAAVVVTITHKQARGYAYRMHV